MLQLDDNVTHLKGAGKRVAERLETLGLRTIRDLLFYLPVRYDDLSQIKTIREVKIGERATIIGEVKQTHLVRIPRRRFGFLNAVIADETGSIRAIWFNQFYLNRILKKGVKVALAGKLVKNKFGLHISAPTYEIIDDNQQLTTSDKQLLHVGKIVPVYGQTRGLTSRTIRQLVKTAFSLVDPAEFEEWLPKNIVSATNYPPLFEALHRAHLPQTLEETDRARERFAFEEIFLFQIKLLKERAALHRQHAPILSTDQTAVQAFLQQFPFSLTESQQRALGEILSELNRPIPMNRLLQGEVGSGKTLIAEVAALVNATHHYQTIVMAPTEILTHQHFERFTNDLKHTDIRVGLLTASTSEFSFAGTVVHRSKRELLDMIAGRRIDILIGTHALLQEDARFNRVGLVIVDEQQRFGVEQRSVLVRRSISDTRIHADQYADSRELSTQKLLPHFLSLTATPIPRTLALAIYGDLDVSTLKEKPFDRKPVKTYVVAPKKRELLWRFLEREMAKNHQVFLVCPRVEVTEGTNANNEPFVLPKGAAIKEAEQQDLKTVKQEFERMKEIFPHRTIGILYGTMKDKEKNTVMERMATGELNLLVASSVVEVGIDLPAATAMVIEGAERFGLSQLHQLRGRIGRSHRQSYCFLIPSVPSRYAFKRLRLVKDSDDGLALAEHDLRIRGAGTFFGIRQSGLPDIAMRALRNPQLVANARHFAKQIIEQDPNLETYPTLKQKLAEKEKVLLG